MSGIKHAPWHKSSGRCDPQTQVMPSMASRCELIHGPHRHHLRRVQHTPVTPHTAQTNTITQPAASLTYALAAGVPGQHWQLVAGGCVPSSQHHHAYAPRRVTAERSVACLSRDTPCKRKETSCRTSLIGSTRHRKSYSTVHTRGTPPLGTCWIGRN